MRIGFGLAIVTLALAGGCQSEQQTLADLRQQLTSRCNTEANAKGEVAPGFDVSRYCTCAADKVLTGRSLADVEKMGKDKAALNAAFGSAAQQCAGEQMQAVVAAQPAAPAEPAAAAEEPAAAAEATE